MIILSNDNDYYTCREEGGERRRPHALRRSILECISRAIGHHRLWHIYTYLIYLLNVSLWIITVFDPCLFNRPIGQNLSATVVSMKLCYITIKVA